MGSEELLELALDLAEAGAGQDAVTRLAEAANSVSDLAEACRRISLRMDGQGALAFGYLTAAVRQMANE